MDTQKRLQGVLDRLVGEQRLRGGQIAVYLRGEPVASCCAGAPSAGGGRIGEDTLFPVFSVTKGMAATAVHMLAERGKIRYDQPLCDLWPEFAVNGKQGVTIAHVLSHTCGVPQIPEGISAEMLNDWEDMCARVAALRPRSAPGEMMEYHAITYGWLTGEIVRRASGMDIGAFVRENIAAPLGARNEMYIGLPDEERPRVAVLEASSREGERIVSAGTPAIPDIVLPLEDWANIPATQRACFPASNGIMTARAVARHFASLLPWGADGVRLLSGETVARASRPFLLNDGTPITRGLGYNVAGHSDIIGAAPGAFGSQGYGGSFGFAEPESGLAVGFVTNTMSGGGLSPLIARECRL